MYQGAWVMKKIAVNGGVPLNGKTDLQGSKNSALPIISATVAVCGVSVIHNCPKLSDVDAALKILEYIGCRVKREGNTLIIDSTSANRWDIPEKLMRSMRSSIVFLGALLSRFGSASVTSPGGCDIGLRPIDLHLSALSLLGAVINEKGGKLGCTFPNGAFGGEISLSFPSVGATENIILASVLAKGETVITNAAREPEIADLAAFLNKCGARISGAGQSVIRISGVNKLGGAEHTIIPDRIIASTYMACTALAGGRIAVNGVNGRHISPVIPIFKAAGCSVAVNDNELIFEAPKRLSRVRYIRTMPYPGFPTDSQALVMAMLTKAKGTSVISEKIFENRFRHVPELVKMGADIRVENGCVAVVEGVDRLHGANVSATDLRGGCALIAAALGAEGRTVISDIRHIDRGFENAEQNLSELGADIKRE